MEGEQPPIEAQNELNQENQESEASKELEIRQETTQRALAEYATLVDDTWEIQKQDNQYVDDVTDEIRALTRIVDDEPRNDSEYYQLMDTKDELVGQVGRKVTDLEAISANLVFPVDSARDEITRLLEQIETEQDANELQRLKTQAVDSFRAVVNELVQKRQDASQVRNLTYNLAADNEGILGYGEADELKDKYRNQSRRFSDSVQELNGQMDRMDTNFLDSNNEHLQNFERVLDELSE